MQNEIEVSGCGECPLRLYGKHGEMLWYCLHPKSTATKETEVFDLCPLKKSSLTIKLKENGHTTTTDAKI